jgi:DNA sulfur modification protein DndD
MRILNITLSNFLCYYGENNRLDFADGLNLILGANGYGKSKLYDAFQWVFRDGITDDKPRLGAAPNAIRSTSELKEALVNERALAEAEVGETIKCEVCIEVTGSQNSTYQLVRRLYVKKLSATEVKPAGGSSLTVFYKDVIVFKPLSEVEGEKVVAQLLPHDIMPYLWFQGERGINNLIDTSSRESLKQVVNKMSDIEKWDEFIKTAQAAYDAADKELKQALSGDTTRKQKAATYQEQQKTAQSKLDSVEVKISEAEKNFDAASAKLDNIAGQFDAASKVSSLEKDLSQREKELKQIVSRLDNLKLGFTKRLFTDSWLLMGTENIVDKFEQKYRDYYTLVTTRQAEKKFEQKSTEEVHKRLSLPKGIPDRVHVVDMLKHEHCIVCNRQALKGSAEYESIKRLLPEEKPKPAPQTAVIPDIEPELRILNRAAFSMRDKYVKADQEIAGTYQEQEDLEDERQELEEQIASLKGAVATEILNSGLSGNGNAGSILISIDSAKRDIANFSGTLEKLRSMRDTYLADLKALENEFSKLSQGGGINPKLEEKRRLLADLRDLTVRTKETQYAKLIQQLEDTANQHFNSMNKQSQAGYGKIRFVAEGNGYVPEIQGEDGKRMDNLNTSQNSSFKLAIIMAIVTANQNRGLARNYPLISDAPMSDFDAVKARDFLAETARTFRQSIVIAKEFLDADPAHPGRYIVDPTKLAQVKEDTEAAGKTLNVYQLVVPPGQSAQSRKSLSVQITRVTV